MERVTWASEVHGVPRAHARASRARSGADTPPTDVAGEGGDWTFRHRREVYTLVAVLAPPAVLRMVGADPLWSLAGLALSAGGVLAWRRRRRPAARSRIEVVGGSRWPWRWEEFCWSRRARRELGHVVALWPWIAEKSGIPYSTLTGAVADPDEGYSLHVRLARGQIGTDIKLPRLATALREFPVGPPTTPDPRRPWEIVLAELPEPVEAATDDEADEPAWSPPEPLDLEAQRLAALRLAVDRLGPEVVSAAELGRRAGNIPRDWMAKHITQLAPQLGLRRVRGGWVRLAMAAGEER